LRCRSCRLSSRISLLTSTKRGSFSLALSHFSILLPLSSVVALMSVWLCRLPPSRQRMKKVLSRRFASAREHRHSTDSRSSVTRDNGGSDQLSRLQGGAYSGGGAIRRGGARKAHSWDVSTYRYTRSGEHLSPENDRPAPSRRVATTPGAALVASATPPPSRTPSEHKSSDK